LRQTDRQTDTAQSRYPYALHTSLAAFWS